MSKQPIRILLARIGVDLHDRGIKIIARALRDAGMEVIYLGPSQLPEPIVKAAIEEDVDAIGISSMEGMHAVRIPEIIRMLRREGGKDVLVIAGGIIPLQDIPKLRKSGVRQVFGPGTPMKEIVEFIQQNASRR